MKKLVSITVLVLMLGISSVAQEKKEVKTSGFQVSFGYPLGSHGSATDYVNDVSFNILYGLNGGVNGFEFGGILNYNYGDVRGVQISGVANINERDTRGFQWSTANLTYGNLHGAQLGVFNYAKKVKGLQIGVINFKDEDEGLSLGIFNIIKNGYFALESTAGETMYANLNYKMGSKKLYTIFKYGYSAFDGKPVHSYGLGFGRLFDVSENLDFSTDLTYNKIVYDGDWSSKENDLYKLDLNLHYKIADKFSVIAGPSLNFYNTNKMVNGKYGTLNTPYTIHEKTNQNSKQFYWIGLNLGLNYQF